jgi:hypothetical protein
MNLINIDSSEPILDVGIVFVLVENRFTNFVKDGL